MSKRVYDTAVRNLVQLSDEDFERAIAEAREKRGQVEEAPKPKSERRPKDRVKTAVKALLPLSDPEFTLVISEAKTRRSEFRDEYEALGGKGDPFTPVSVTIEDMIAHDAAVSGEGYQLALTTLLTLSDNEFEMVVSAARAERMTDAEWSTLAGGPVNELVNHDEGSATHDRKCSSAGGRG